MQKTYSQKVARVFEIVCYLLLIPTFLSLIYPFFIFIGGLFSVRSEVVLFSLIPFIIAGIGITLLVGYFKHSRGELSEENIPALWITTAVYNLLLLLPWLYVAASYLQNSERHEAESGGVPTEFFYVLLFVFGYIAAIVFSMSAYSSEKRKKNTSISHFS